MPTNCGSAACSCSLGRNRRGRQLDDLALDIFRIARPAEQERAAIGLRHPLHVFDQPRRRADGDDEHAGRQRIERARVADLVRLARAAARD